MSTNNIKTIVELVIKNVMGKRANKVIASIDEKPDGILVYLSHGATLGVVLPSFIIILLVCSLIRNFLKYKGVQAFLGGVRPCIVALILATAVTMAASTLLSFTTLTGGFAPDVIASIILGTLFGIIGYTVSHKVTFSRKGKFLNK